MVLWHSITLANFISRAILDVSFPSSPTSQAVSTHQSGCPAAVEWVFLKQINWSLLTAAWTLIKFKSR